MPVITCHRQVKRGILNSEIHDLSLAAQFSDELILLGEGKVQGVGDAHHVLQVETINRLYRVNVELLQCSAGLPVVRPQRKSAHS